MELSCAKVGGVTEMRKVMALAQTSGVQVVPHSAYFGPGLGVEPDAKVLEQLRVS